MATAPLGTVLRHLRQLTADRCVQQWSDRELLEDFAARRSDAAFAALVSRHGPMVLRVCRRVLGHEHDAEDAFQATFLVLAQRTASIRKRHTVGDWLHGVAYRTAMKAKRSAARRRNHEARVRAAVPRPAISPTWDDVQAVLDQAIQRLPRRFREAFVLCVLEGKSGAEAAADLGCKEGTVKSRVNRARRSLQQELARRGIQLAAVLAALSVAETAAAAGVSATLARSTIRTGLWAAAGRSAAGIIPSHVAALAAGVTRAMFLTKAKIATCVLLALCLAAGTLLHRARADRGTAAAGPPAAPSAAVKEKAPRQPAQPDRDAVTYRGCVLGPNDQPVAGARVYYHFITRADDPVPVRAVTDAKGHFSFTLNTKDVPLSADMIRADPRKAGQVVVQADGFTFGWMAVMRQQGDLTLRLARDDTPVEGRILDLEGKPVAGLRVTVFSAAAGDLSGFVKVIQAGEPLYAAISKNLPNYLGNPIIGRREVPLLPSTTTDKDGHFRLHGFAKDQLLEVHIEGPTIETQDVFVMNRPVPGSGRLGNPPRVKDPNFGPSQQTAVLGNGFEHAVVPGQTVVGTVRDAASGRPIALAVVESYMLAGTNLAQNTLYHAAADDQGRYRLTGLPRGKGNRIRVRPPDDAPYLPAVQTVPPAETFTAATVDVGLTRGVWVDVTASDKATGEPVPGFVSYFALPKDPSADRFSRPFADAYNDFMSIRNDGTFRFVAAPQRAILGFRADWEKYPIARDAATIVLPSGLSPSNFQAFTEINPKAGDGPVKVAFVLDARHKVTGRLIDPDGKPVAGALPAGLRDDWFWGPDLPLKADQFRAIGLDPARPRLVAFAHLERKLAGSVVLRGDEPGPVTVRLVPWATVFGRLLDADGRPVKDADLSFTQVPPAKPGQPRATDAGLLVTDPRPSKASRFPRTDAEGRFRIEGLIPGLKYNLAPYDRKQTGQVRWQGLAFTGVVLEPGEVKDLGELKLLPFPKE
jgi:RNA polymerase sigma factor (sigma-70 family)